MPTLTVTNYYTDNGRIVGEKVGTGARTDYLTDALGSVTGTVNQSGQLQKTIRYKPYGAQLSLTGRYGNVPVFQWNGSWGYRPTSLQHSDYYVRARHYATAEGRWTTVDPWWPGTPTYDYCLDDPIVWSDASGLQVTGSPVKLPIVGPPIVRPPIVRPPIVRPPIVRPPVGEPVEPVKPVKPGPGTAPFAWLVILLGIEACCELGRSYSAPFGEPTGPCTWLGWTLARWWIPIPIGTPAPARPLPPIKPFPKKPTDPFWSPPQVQMRYPGCPNPCPPPCWRYFHEVPPQPRHYPCPGNHVIWIMFNQQPPPSCECKENKYIQCMRSQAQRPNPDLKCV